jgi:hypothetical protein
MRDAVGVVPYEPAQSLKHNDTRGKTVRPCHVNIPYPPMTVGGASLFTRGTGGGFKFYIKRDAVGVVPYEPVQSLKHNDTRGKTVCLCHVNIPYPPMTVGGDAHGAP